MKAVENKIQQTEADLAEAKMAGDTARRDTLESLLMELWKEKNFLRILQQQQQPATSNFSHMNFNRAILHFPIFPYRYTVYSIHAFLLIDFSFIC